LPLLLLLQCHPSLHHLHSFPTRRSSDLAFSLASLACSFNEPINCPDRTLVLTRHTSSSASDVTNKRVERFARRSFRSLIPFVSRSEEHTSELQSLRHLVCRLLLEKKKIV